MKTSFLPTLSAAILLFASAVVTMANPAGEVVQAGSATFTRGGPGSLSVNQTTDKVIIDWRTFSIGAGEVTRFIQPNASSAALNRVLGGNPSQIYGMLQANGQVYVINPAGILVGPSGVINTRGFVGSTLDINNASFLSGVGMRFEGSSSASVRNEGTISALGGDVFLFAHTVENAGSLDAASGTVGLAAGREILLRQSGNERISVLAGNISAPQTATGVNNAGAVQAASAELQAAGGNIYALAINNGGIVRANTMVNQGGRILLKASGGNIQNSGTLNASGSTGGSVTVDGGHNAAAPATVVSSGTIDASGSTGAGGTAKVLGDHVGLFGSALVDVSGATGGGTALIGGDFQGRNPEIQNALRTHIDPNAHITADALTLGNGGRVIVWADEVTRYYGSISARGGSVQGNGGFAEVSGKDSLLYRGTADLRARSADGATGALLLDPKNIIVATDPSALDDVTSANPGQVTVGAVFADNAVVGQSQIFGIRVTDLQNALDSASVTLQANNDITFLNDVTRTDAIGLTLRAGRSITLDNASIDLGNGLFNATFNDQGATSAQREPGAAVFSMIGTASISAGGGVTIQGGTLAAHNSVAPTSVSLNTGNISLTTITTTKELAGNGQSGAISVINNAAPGKDISVAGTLDTRGRAALLGNNLGAKGGDILLNASGDLTLETLVASGGNGSGDGNAGAAGKVTLTAGGLIKANNTVTAVGGNADTGNGDDASGGTGGEISFNAGTTIEATATISANGGAGRGTGDGGNAGTVSFTVPAASSANTISFATVTANGGAGGANGTAGAANNVSATGHTLNLSGTPAVGSLSRPLLSTVNTVVLNKTGGNTFLTESDTLNLQGSTTGDLTVVVTTGASSISAALAAANLTLNTSMLSLDNAVTITGTATLNNSGAVSGAGLFTVPTLNLNGAGAVGSLVTPLNLTVGTVVFTRPALSGAVFLNETDDIILQGNTGGASVSVRATDVNVPAALGLGAGVLSLTAVGDRSIFLGDGGAGTDFTLTGAQLQNITTSGGLSLITTGTGDITVDNTASANSANVTGPLQLRSADSLTFANNASTFVNVDAQAGTAININAAVITSGNQAYTANTIDLTADVSTAGGGTLTLQPVTTTRSIGLGTGAAGDLLLDNTDIGHILNGFSGIFLGRADGQHAIDVRAVTFVDPVTIRTPSGGSITINGQLRGNGNASIMLDGSGATTTLNADIVTAGNAILINDSVIIAQPTITLDTTDAGGTSPGAPIQIDGSINGDGVLPRSLTLTGGTAGNITINTVGDTTPLAALVATGNQLTLGGNISLDGGTALNFSGVSAVVLANNVTIDTDAVGGAIAAGNVTFGAATINGDGVLARSLIINATSDSGPAGTITLGPVGGTTPLASLEATGAQITAAAVTTSGDQTYTADTITLNGDLQIAAMGSGALVLQPLDPMLNISIGSLVVGSLSFDNTALGHLKNGFTSITFGRANGQHAITVAGGNFEDTVVFRSPMGTTTLNGNLNNNTGGGFDFSQAGSVILAGNTIIDTDAAGGNFNAGLINFGTTAVNGSGVPVTLELNTTADGTGTAAALTLGTLGNTAPLGGLTVSGGALTLNGNIFLDGGSGIDFSGVPSIMLGNNVLIDTDAPTSFGFAAGSVNFGTVAVNGDMAGRTLTVDARANGVFISAFGDITLGPVGDSIPLGALSASGGALALNGNIFVDGGGDVSLSSSAAEAILLRSSVRIDTDAVGGPTVAGDVTLAGSRIVGNAAGRSLIVDATVNGAVVPAGVVTLAPIGVNPQPGEFAPLSVNASGASLVANAVTTTGNQNYTVNTIDLNGNLQSTGGGSLVLQPFDLATSIGLGTLAAGTFHLDDNELNFIQDGFSGIFFGQTGGSHAISVNAPLKIFTDNVIFRSSGGTLTLAGNLSSDMGAGFSFADVGSIVLGGNATIDTDATDPVGPPTLNNAGVVDFASKPITADMAGRSLVIDTSSDSGSSSALTLGAVGTGAIPLTSLSASASAVTLNGAVRADTVSLTVSGTIAAVGQITANSLSLSAASGIGDALNPVQTDVANLEAATITGGIFIDNARAVNIGGVSGSLFGVRVATSGDIVLNNQGTVSILQNGEIIKGPGNITVNANGLTSDLVTGGNNNGNSGNGALNSGGVLIAYAGQNILLGSGGEYGDIRGQKISMTADNDVRVTSSSFVDAVGVPDGMGNGGELTITASQDITLTGGRLTTAGGKLRLNGVTLTLNSTVNAGTGTLILNNSGAVNATGTLSADTLLLEGLGAVGSAGGRISTVINSLVLDKTMAASGNTFVTDTGTLNLSGTTTGNLDVSAGAMTLVAAVNAANATLNGTTISLGAFDLSAAGVDLTHSGALTTGAGKINATTLTLNGAGAVGVDAGNRVNTAAGTIVFNKAGGSSFVNEMDAVNLQGTTGNGGVDVLAVGGIALTGALNAGMGDIALSGTTIGLAGFDLTGVNVTLNNSALASSGAGRANATTLTLNGSGDVGAGGARFNTGAGSIVFNKAGANAFLNELDAVNIQGSAALLDLVAGGAVDQSAALATPVLTVKTLSDAGAAITLNSFVNEATTVDLRSRNALDIAIAAGAISYSDATGVDIAAIQSAGDVIVTAGGPISQSGVVTANGALRTATFSAAGQVITLGDANNDFTTAKFTGSDVTVKDQNALDLGTSTVTGDLSVTTVGAITQSGTVTANGAGKAATFSAAGQTIALGDANNDFTTAKFTGADVTVYDLNALDLGASTVTGNLNLTAAGSMMTPGGITQSGTVTANGVGKTATFNVSADKDVLLGLNNDFTSVSVPLARNITLKDINGFTLGQTAARNGTLFLETTTGDITQILPADRSMIKLSGPTVEAWNLTAKVGGALVLGNPTPDEADLQPLNKIGMIGDIMHQGQLYVFDSDATAYGPGNPNPVPSTGSAMLGLTINGPITGTGFTLIQTLEDLALVGPAGSTVVSTTGAGSDIELAGKNFHNLLGASVQTILGVESWVAAVPAGGPQLIKTDAGSRFLVFSTDRNLNFNQSTDTGKLTFNGLEANFLADQIKFPDRPLPDVDGTGDGFVFVLAQDFVQQNESDKFFIQVDKITRFESVDATAEIDNLPPEQPPTVWTSSYHLYLQEREEKEKKKKGSTQAELLGPLWEAGTGGE